MANPNPPLNPATLEDFLPAEQQNYQPTQSYMSPTPAPRNSQQPDQPELYFETPTRTVNQQDVHLAIQLLDFVMVDGVLTFVVRNENDEVYRISPASFSTLGQRGIDMVADRFRLLTYERHYTLAEAALRDISLPPFLVIAFQHFLFTANHYRSVGSYTLTAQQLQWDTIIANIFGPTYGIFQFQPRTPGRVRYILENSGQFDGHYFSPYRF
jgi:hypothetical protein